MVRILGIAYTVVIADSFWRTDTSVCPYESKDFRDFTNIIGINYQNTQPMITELTPEQEAQLKIYVEKWRKIALSTEPANRLEAERGIYLAYQSAELKPPEEILWFESPLKLCQYRMEISDTPLCKKVASYPIHFSHHVLENVISQDIRRVVSNSIIDDREVYLPVTQLIVNQAVRDIFPYPLSQVVRQQNDYVSMAKNDYFRSVLGLTNETNTIHGLLIVAQNAGWWSPSENMCLTAERPMYYTAR